MNVLYTNSGNCPTVNTKIIDIGLIQFFFILSTDQSFEIFPKYNGVATISESFVLN